MNIVCILLNRYGFIEYEDMASVERALSATEDQFTLDGRLVLTLWGTKPLESLITLRKENMLKKCMFYVTFSLITVAFFMHNT